MRMGAALAAVLTVGLIGATTAGAATTPRGLQFNPQAADTFDFGTIAAGQTSSQVFTLTPAWWDRWSGRIRVNLSGSPAFTIVSDSCSGAVLRYSRQSCEVLVQYAPAAAGQKDTATLNATGARTFWWHRWHHHRWNDRQSAGVTLTGASTAGGGGGGNTGPATLQLSPGTLTGTTGVTNAYTYNFGMVKTLATTFTVKNTGGQTSPALTLADWDNGGFALSNDTCSGHTLAPNATCTFTETWTSRNDPSCDGPGNALEIEPAITAASPATTYVDAELTAGCA